jgi:hypothetical protein
VTDLPNGPAFPAPQPWALPAARPRVPAAVQAAAIVTYVCCGLVVLMTMLFLLAAAVVSSDILDLFEGPDRADIVLFAVGAAAGSFVACALACVFAWLTWRRKAWARIALAGCCGVSLALSVVALGPPTVVVLPGAVAVLVLLFLPQSNAWFRIPSAGAPATQQPRPRRPGSG